MSLEQEIEQKAKQIHTDGYSLSIGELMSLYRDKEIDIHPEFQRFFRWTLTQKSKLIESILLGIPIPPIFVSQRDDGVWDVIDGLQRLSTILEFSGLLRDSDDNLIAGPALSGTDYLPSLEGKYWQKDDDQNNSFALSQRLIVKRSKLGVQIIKKESDADTKFELFQRLNTGGTPLTEQEIRNCILVMINKDFYSWLGKLSKNLNFKATIPITERALEEQYDVELALRFLVYKNIDNIDFTKDVGKLLTDKVIEFASNANFDYESETRIFEKVFLLLNNSLGEDVFRKWDHTKEKFSGPFSISAFETIALGLAKKLDLYENTPQCVDNLREIIKGVSQNPIFIEKSGTGKRASTRVPHLLPLGEKLFGNED